MRKTIFFVLLVLVLVSGPVYAQQAGQYAKENSIAMKVGGHFYSGSDFMDYWKADASDFDSVAFEVAYERMLTPTIGLEIPLGYNQGDSTYNDVLAAGDTNNINIENIYLSPGLKFHIPVNEAFGAYLGGGFDLYRTSIKNNYNDGSTSINASDTLYSFGLHGIAGIDWYFYNLETSVPVSLFAEYRYTWLKIDDADDKILNDLNSSAAKNELEVGGSTLFTGLRWHF